MRHAFPGLLIVLASLLLSCQKEKVYDPDNPSGGNFFRFYIDDGYYGEDYESGGGRSVSLVKSAYDSVGDSLCVYAKCGGPHPIVSYIVVWIQLAESDIREGNTIHLDIKNQTVLYHNGSLLGHMNSDIISGQVTIKRRKKDVLAASFEIQVMVNDEMYVLSNGFFDVAPYSAKVFQDCKKDINRIKLKGW